MASAFLYDTHYQVDSPLALIHLTLAAASPTKSYTDEVLAKRMAQHFNQTPRKRWSEATEWKNRFDSMKYWIGNCHQADLLSRQNAYDYWLINFAFASAFVDKPSQWGELDLASEPLARMLLFRWGWLFDGPILAALAWQAAKQEKTPGIDDIEEVLVSVLRALRARTADVREQASYRELIERIHARPLKPNTRRHKLITHLSILRDSGLLSAEWALRSDLEPVILGFGSTMDEVVEEFFRPSPIGRGGRMFLALAGHADAATETSLTEERWRSYKPILSKMWSQTMAWDRKFLSIPAIAEFFVVKGLLQGTSIVPEPAWRAFLMERSRYMPDEVTVHVNRFGATEFLRL
jgi:hypothetical protein